MNLNDMEQLTKGPNNLLPTDIVNGFPVRPGFYRVNGAVGLNEGVSFTICSMQATSCELLLFRRKENEPYAIIPFPEHYRIGYVYSMIVLGINIEEFEYAYRIDGPFDPRKGLVFDKTKCLLDPYAKSVTGQSVWGQREKDGAFYKARVVKNDFDWGNCEQPLIPMEDLIIYEMHVRGFTKDSSAEVKYLGTFKGVEEKIPYLKDLGINAIEFMPIFEFDELRDSRVVDGQQVLDYWGYNSVSFFAPNTSYCAGIEYNREGTELKQLIKTLKANDMEVFLDVVFNHTAEGNENGPFFSFKGFDNNVYYMLTPNGNYFNFSGCGNTLNCNHPIVHEMILECLRYWVIEYRVDGFRFDLASILGRNENGSPMSQPPLLRSLAFDPILGNVKLIAEAWDAGGLYQVGSFPSWKRWAEWNGRYRDDMRSFLKGDDGKAEAAAFRMMGSLDLYPLYLRGQNASVNFITCHDGFTLHDLYAYNGKHNEKNGWDNTDGTNQNLSWNCGCEGETTDAGILKLRKKLVKNACLVLMCSRGTPMFLAGDEFGNTQFGNNNAYCQDNIISWLDWTLLTKNKELHLFFKYMIRFRKEHVILRRNTGACSFGFPQVSRHGIKAFTESYNWEDKLVGIMYAGKHQENDNDDVIFVAINVFWEKQLFELPQAPDGYQWKVIVDTEKDESVLGLYGYCLSSNVCSMYPRSAKILILIKESEVY